MVTIQANPMRLWKRFLAAAALLLAIAAAGYLWMVIGPSTRAIDLKIRAHASDGTPLAGATIIVSAWDYGVFDSNYAAFSEVTDDNGEARVAVWAGYPVREIWVEAWSKSFKEYGISGRATYASKYIAGNPKEIPRVHFKPNQGVMTVTLNPLSEKEFDNSQSSYRYQLDKVEITRHRLQLRSQND